MANKAQNKAQIVSPIGTKGISLTSDSQWVDFLLEKKSTGNVGSLYHSVPWLHRATEIRQHAMASMPFAIMRGGTDVDTSADYQNKIKFMPDPARLFAQMEGAMTLFGSAYLLNAKNRVATKELRYLHPATMKPVMHKTDGLIGFKRKIDGKEMKFDVDDIIYVWGVDPTMEFGPPNGSPATAAIGAAGVLMSVDDFAQRFFENGAMKTTVFSVPGSTPPAEKDRFKKFVQRIIGGGLQNAFNVEVLNSDGVNTHVIGEGIQELSNTALTNEKREEIATALGIPHSLLFSNAANFATARQDATSFMTRTVVPEAEIIQQAINAQLFEPMGLRFEFRPESTEAFQEEEVHKARAFREYSAVQKPGIVGEMMGLDLPQGMDWDMFQAEAEEWIAHLGANRQQANVADTGGDGGETKATTKDTTTSEMEQDFIRWRRKSLKSLKAGKGALVKFTSVHIDSTMAGAINGSLERAKSSGTVKAIFEDAIIWADYPGVEHPMINAKAAPTNIVVNVPATSVDVAAPEIKIDNLAAEAPEVIVNVAPEVKAPDVKIEVTPEVKAADVVVNVSPTPVEIKNDVKVNLPADTPRKTTVKRNRKGEITDMETK